MIELIKENAPKSSLSDYLNWFEDAYFLFTVRMFDASFRKSNANPKKIYCIDHSLIRSVSSGILTNSGHILENIVFMALRRLTTDVFYYKTRNSKEVDFVFRNREGNYVPVQVCESLVNAATRRRELDALEIAMEELQIKNGYIITRNEAEKIMVKSGLIEIIPVWRFLLNDKLQG